MSQDPRRPCGCKDQSAEKTLPPATLRSASTAQVKSQVDRLLSARAQARTTAAQPAAPIPGAMTLEDFLGMAKRLGLTITISSPPGGS